MKKLAVLAAVVVMAALAAPAFSMTNPFMDVPMNHWAYDAIGQLAAHGILSGFPDGTYKGQQQTTRYEMASALARSLAVVDMTKASKQDVEMLKRLVVEFKDELEALGVRVDELDERVSVLENRLGGWHIHGTLVAQIINESKNEARDAFTTNGKGTVGFDEARIFFERTWGENDEYFFRARLRNEGSDHGGVADSSNNSAYFDRFYVEMPFFFDTKFTVGRFNWAWEGDYKISLPETGGWTGDQVLTDWTFTGFGLTKNFGLGVVEGAVAHPDKKLPITGLTFNDGDTLSNWMVMARASLQFTEQFGFDIGGQAYFGDNAEWRLRVTDTATGSSEYYGEAFNKLWTIFAGLRFNFTDNIGLKGIFYHQKADTEVIGRNPNTGYFEWQENGYGILDGDSYEDSANHWAAILDVKQEALKFTSLWLEYGQYKKGFVTRNDSGIFYGALNATQQAIYDTKYWRIGAGQQWNDQWATYLFYYGYDYDETKPKEWGLGVQYKMNDYTTFGLNYMHADKDNAADDKDNVVRFRTKVTF